MIPQKINDLYKRSENLNGSDFLKSIMPPLANEFDLDFVLVGKYVVKTKNVQAIVYSKADDKFLALIYELSKTPCEVVTQKNFCVYPKGVAALFPEDLLLSEMNIEGYVGVSFESDVKKLTGVFVGLTHASMESSEAAGESLGLFTSKIASEIEREGVKILDPDNFQ